METREWLEAQELLPEGFPGGKGPLLGSGKRISKEPTSFQPNMGQMPSGVDFAGKSKGYRVYVTGTDLVFDMLSEDEGQLGVNPGVVTVSLVGANMMLAGHGEDKRPGISNYFYGNDPSKWVHNVPTYSKVRYEGVYPGIDLVFYGNSERSMEHDFIVSPGADYRQIKLDIQGAHKIEVSKQGHINIEAIGGGKLRLKKPLVYQMTSMGTKIEISSHYELVDNQLSFWINESQYDRSLDLVIDPVTLAYSSYLGGAADDDVVLAMAVDSSDNVYVTGWTKSSNFPTISGFRDTHLGSSDGFVSKISSSGALTNSTFYGGGGIDVFTSISIDSADGKVYLGGYTTASIPTAGGPLSPPFYIISNQGGYDAIFVVFDSALSVRTVAAYLGGSGFDAIMDIALDKTSTSPTCTGSGTPCVVVVGSTTSTGLNTGSPYQSSIGGDVDAFVAKITMSSVAVNALTYYGGTGRDVGIGVAVETSGTTPSIHIAGYTNSSSAIASGGVFQTSLGGVRDGFAAKFASTLSTRTYGTYLGGAGDESVGGIAINPTTGSGSAYVIGTTTNGSSGSFTATNGKSYNSGKDIFIANLNSGATGLNYLTFIGGSGTDDVPGIQSIAVDSMGRAWFAGRTTTSGISMVGVDAVTNGTVSKYSTYPSGATSVGILGRIDGVNVGSNHSLHAYHSTNSASAVNLLSAVALKDATSTSVYLGGYASETGLDLYGTTTRSYSGLKDAQTLQISLPSTGCPANAIANCERGYEVKGLEIYVLKILSSSSTRPNVSMSIPAINTVSTTLACEGAETAGVGPNSSFIMRMAPEGSASAYPTEPANSHYRGLQNNGTPPAETVTGWRLVLRYQGEKLSPGTSCGSSPTAGQDYIICAAESASTSETPTATATLPSGYTLIGGGGWIGVDAANQDDVKNFIYESYPSATLSWTVTSKAHLVSDPRKATAYVVGLNLSSTRLSPGGFSVNTSSVTSSSSTGPITQTCTVSAGSLIGGGARATYTGDGRMLEASFPFSQTQWRGKSSDSVNPDNGTLTTYCIGIQ